VFNSRNASSELEEGATLHPNVWWNKYPAQYSPEGPVSSVSGRTCEFCGQQEMHAPDDHPRSQPVLITLGKTTICNPFVNGSNTCMPRHRNAPLQFGVRGMEGRTHREGPHTRLDSSDYGTGAYDKILKDDLVLNGTIRRANVKFHFTANSDIEPNFDEEDTSEPWFQVEHPIEHAGGIGEGPGGFHQVELEEHHSPEVEHEDYKECPACKGLSEFSGQKILDEGKTYTYHRTTGEEGCPACKNTGSVASDTPECENCLGSGKNHHLEQDKDGNWGKCKNCEGSGLVIDPKKGKTACSNCSLPDHPDVCPTCQGNKVSSEILEKKKFTPAVHKTPASIPHEESRQDEDEDDEEDEEDLPLLDEDGNEPEYEAPKTKVEAPKKEIEGPGLDNPRTLEEKPEEEPEEEPAESGTRPTTSIKSSCGTCNGSGKKSNYREIEQSPEFKSQIKNAPVSEMPGIVRKNLACTECSGGEQ